MATFNVRPGAPGPRIPKPLMPLFLALLIVIGIVGLLKLLNAGQRRPRSEHAYRPRGRATGSSRQRQDEPRAHWFATRAELEGLRDAYSSAPLDLARPLARCGDCQAHYQAESLAALQREHGGRCALCGGHDLRPVHLA